jgi:hypothetical protein
MRPLNGHTSTNQSNASREPLLVPDCIMAGMEKKPSG